MLPMVFKGNALLGKQCICSHKYSKQLSGVTAGKLFLLVGGTAPKPLFAEFHSAAARRSGAFFLPPAEIFRKWRGWLTSIIANFPVEGNGIFSKSVRLVEPQPDQRRGLFKGLGMLPNKQNLRFPASPGTVVLSVCIYKRPACPVAHGCCFRWPSTKFSPKALTGTSVCVIVMGN